jgi:hypothetical protein
MGCDIHIYTEALETVNSQPQWNNVDNWRLNKYARDEGESPYTQIPVYRRRDYSLFAVLAGVRDYSDSGNPVIAEPRGLPSDVSPSTKTASDEIGVDGHTHSWLTLLELRQAAAKLDGGVLPDEWCQGTTRKDVVRREWEMPNTGLADLIKALEDRARDVFWIFNDGPLSDEIAAKVRIVFWFDN